VSRDLDVEQLRTLAAAARERSTCPPAELLARAAAGEADATERGVIADHLASCDTCSEEYRTAVALGPWARAASADPIFSGPTRRTAPAWRTRTFAYAATALLALGATAALTMWGLTLRGENARLTAALQQRGADAAAGVAARDDAQAKTIAELQGQLAEARSPTLNTPIVDLLPRDAVRGSPQATMPRVPAGATHVTLVITTASDPAAWEHELEIVDPAGAVRWRGSGLRPNAERAFTATVPVSLMPAGTCHVRLYERRNEGPRLVADYSIVVQR
jgi:hypothetical protein